MEAARTSLSILRGHPGDSDYVENELYEIIVNAEYERKDL